MKEARERTMGRRTKKPPPQRHHCPFFYRFLFFQWPLLLLFYHVAGTGPKKGQSQELRKADEEKKDQDPSIFHQTQEKSSTAAENIWELEDEAMEDEAMEDEAMEATRKLFCFHSLRDRIRARSWHAQMDGTRSIDARTDVKRIGLRGVRVIRKTGDLWLLVAQRETTFPLPVFPSNSVALCIRREEGKESIMAGIARGYG